jgi:hypothetical protein
MLTKKDLGLIAGLLDDKLDIQKREIRDETYSMIKASEAGLKRYIDESLGEAKSEIIDSIIDVIDRGILPQIEEHAVEIRKIKRHLQLA